VAVVVGEVETAVLFCLWADTTVQVVHAFFQQKWRKENNIKERKRMNKMKDTREILFLYFVMVIEWGWLGEGNNL
jgi:hypothetical protein